MLARPSKEIKIKYVLQALGGMLYDKDFCGQHTGSVNLCTNSVDCSARSLWQMIQFTVDQLLDKITLYDMANSPKNESTLFLRKVLEEVPKLV